MQEEFEKRNHTWAEEEVRVRKKRQIKVWGGGKKKHFSNRGQKHRHGTGLHREKRKNATLQFGMLVFK